MTKYLCSKSCFVRGVFYNGGQIYPLEKAPNKHFKSLEPPSKKVQDEGVNFETMSSAELLGAVKLWTRKDLSAHAKKKYQATIPANISSEKMVDVFVNMRDGK